MRYITRPIVIFLRAHANNGEVENNWKTSDFSFKNKTQFTCVPGM